MSGFLSGRGRWILLSLLVFVATGTWALVPKPGGPEKKRVILEHADLLLYDEAVSPGAQRLIGNVRFRHGNATMDCDSAYFFEATNSFEAFGRIHMNQADSVNLYAQHLFYNGETRMAELRNDVSLTKGGQTLYTDNLDYDRNTATGYYFNGGTLVDTLNTLTSDYGQYNTDTDDADFSENVRLENPDFVLTTENLHYNTRDKVANFLGQTLVESDSGHIVSTRGVYDTNRNLGILLDRSTVYSKDYQVTGDSLYYDKARRFAEAFGDMTITDTTNKARLYGEYGYYDEVRRYAFATERAYAIDYSKKDTLFVAADTLELISYKTLSLPKLLPSDRRVPSNNGLPGFDSLQFKADARHPVDTLPLLPGSVSMDSLPPAEIIPIAEQPDSLPGDSIEQRIFRAYHHVRIFRNDAQAVADSMDYYSVDSVATLYGRPLCWVEGDKQLQSDTLRGFIRNEKLDHARAIGATIGMQRLDSLRYNQISANIIEAFFQDSTVRQIDAYGNVDLIYFIKKDNQKYYHSVDRTQGPEWHIYMAADTVSKTIWKGGQIDGRIIPLKLLKPEDARFPSAVWHDALRPKSRYDIFPDSIPGSYRRKPLHDIARFSGAKAALLAYRRLANSTADTLVRGGVHAVDSLRTSDRTSEHLTPSVLSPFIARMQPEQDAEALFPHFNPLYTWPYFPLSKEQPGSSTTDPYIGIRKRSDSNVE